MKNMLSLNFIILFLICTTIPACQSNNDRSDNDSGQSDKKIGENDSGEGWKLQSKQAVYQVVPFEDMEILDPFYAQWEGTITAVSKTDRIEFVPVFYKSYIEGYYYIFRFKSKTEGKAELTLTDPGLNEAGFDLMGLTLYHEGSTENIEKKIDFSYTGLALTINPTRLRAKNNTIYTIEGSIFPRKISLTKGALSEISGDDFRYMKDYISFLELRENNMFYMIMEFDDYSEDFSGEYSLTGDSLSLKPERLNSQFDFQYEYIDSLQMVLTRVDKVEPGVFEKEFALKEGTIRSVVHVTRLHFSR